MSDRPIYIRARDARPGDVVVHSLGGAEYVVREVIRSSTVRWVDLRGPSGDLLGLHLDDFVRLVRRDDEATRAAELDELIHDAEENDSVTMRWLINEAATLADLSGDEDVNPEYTRALVELVGYALAFPMADDDHREAVLRRLRKGVIES